MIQARDVSQKVFLWISLLLSSCIISTCAFPFIVSRSSNTRLARYADSSQPMHLVGLSISSSSNSNDEGDVSPFLRSLHETRKRMNLPKNILETSSGNEGLAMTMTEVDDCCEGHLDEDEAPTKKGYQRAEEWHAEVKARKVGMSWEEKVQYDGLRHGNRFNQNEILRKNISGF
eukprot:77275_1